MNALTVMYWTRFLLGIIAALISTLLSTITGFSLLNGISIALLVYIITYYVYKAMFLAKVEKASKIFTTGVGIYFLSWIVVWVILFTIFVYQAPSP